MILGFNGRAWFYRQPVDFRKQLDGLIYLVVNDLNDNPTSGDIFVFRNKQQDKVKIIMFDGNGFWLCYKRLEKGKFKFPAPKLEKLNLSRDQLSWLLSGIDFMGQEELPKVDVKYFY